MARTGRPRSFDRDEALVHAMHLFWRHGYEGASLERLRHVMGGLSPASFYAAFGSKAGLYREALTLYSATHGRAVAPLTDEQLPPRERIEQTLRRSVRMQTDPSHPAGCMVALDALPSAADADELKALTAAARTANRAGIIACVRAGVDAGDLRPDVNQVALATLFDTLLTGFSVEIVDGASADVLEEAITVALTLWDKSG